MSERTHHSLTYFGDFSLYSGYDCMEIGTDAVLLGMLTDTGNCGEIADFCTGSGVIGILICRRLLMLGVKAHLTGIDISPRAVATARINAERAIPELGSTWISGNIRDMIWENTGLLPRSLDLIVCNPPYYDANDKTYPSPTGQENGDNSPRKEWRSQTKLGLLDIADSACQLLKTDGTLAMVIPKELWQEYETEFWLKGLKLRKLINITTKEGKNPQRVIVQLRNGKVLEKEREVCSFTLLDRNGALTTEYKALKKACSLL